jgi:hypothetical protein
MAVKNIIKAIPLTNFASASLTTDYQAINTTGLSNSCCILRLNSTSSTSVTVSYDGVNDHEFLLAGASFTIPVQANSQPNNFIANFPIGMQVYVKGTAGTGNIYLSGYYQPTAG